MMEFKKLENGFEYIEIQNSVASAKIALQGAHIFEHVCFGKKDILWLSKIAKFEEKFPIRGGIPICWPWFGPNKENPSLPQHGFARISQFSLHEYKEIDENTTLIVLKLTSSQETQKIWPYSFELFVYITLSDTLHVKLKTLNTDSQPFTITQALHTYFSVKNITDTVILGLENEHYFDQLTASFTQQNGSVVFENAVDRIYKVSKNVIIKEDFREIFLENSGSNSLVVWNPWHEKNEKISDMQNGTYTQMLCVETANALDDKITIKPQENYSLCMKISDKE